MARMPARHVSMQAPLLLVCLTLLLTAATALEAVHCEATCSRVDASDRGVCSMITFSVCPQKPTWAEEAAQAQLALDKILATGGVNTTLETLPAECASLLARQRCMLSFPPCELGDVKRLCEGCEEVTKACNGTGLSTALMCQGQFANKKVQCVPLDYDGPNVAMWIGAVLISVIFSFLAALGINLQKHSMSITERQGLTTSPWRQHWWVVGFALISMGSLLDFVAFGMASQSSLAPLAALSLVWNILIAPRFHDETVTRRNLCATAVIIGGVTSSVVAAPQVTATYQLSMLDARLESPIFVVYILCVILVLIGLKLLARRIERQPQPEKYRLWHLVCYGGLGGIFGGQSVLLAKSTVELLKGTIFDGNNAFAHVEFYGFAAGMVVCLLCQITFLNTGLAKFDALQMVPTYQACWIISSILGGMMFFEEYTSLTFTKSCVFIAGTAVTVGGIGMLLGRPAPGEVDTLEPYLPPLEKLFSKCGGNNATSRWRSLEQHSVLDDEDDIELILRTPAEMRKAAEAEALKARRHPRGSTGSAGSAGSALGSAGDVLSDISDVEDGSSQYSEGEASERSSPDSLERV